MMNPRRHWRRFWRNSPARRLFRGVGDAWESATHLLRRQTFGRLRRWRSRHEASWEQSSLRHGFDRLVSGLHRSGRRLRKLWHGSGLQPLWNTLARGLRRLGYPAHLRGRSRLQAWVDPLTRHWEGSRLQQWVAGPLDRVRDWWFPRPGRPVNRLQVLWSRRKAFRPWLFRWQTLTWLLPLLLLGAWGYRDGRPALRRFREARAAAEADRFFHAGKYREAIFRARWVVDRAPTNPIALRILADLAEGAEPAQALYWRQRYLAAAPGITNQLALALTALRVEKPPFPLAQATLDAVAPADRARPDFQRVSAAVALRRGETAVAGQHFSELVRLEPTNAVNQWSLSLFQLGSTNGMERQEARGRLTALATQPEVGLRALRPLVQERLQSGDLAEAQRVSAGILTNAEATFSDRVMHLRVLDAARSPQVPAFLAATQGQVGTNALAAVELMEWMNRTGRDREALGWFSNLPPAVTQPPRMRLLHAQGYLMQERWAEVEAGLMTENWAGMEPIRHALIAFAASKQGKRQVEALSWRVALASGSGSVGMLQRLGALTRHWQWAERQEEVLWQMVERHPEEASAWPALYQRLNARPDTEKYLRLFRLAHKKDPRDADMSQNLARSALLLGRDLPMAHALAASAHAGSPTNALYAATAALSLLKQGRTTEALGVWSKLPEAALRSPSIALYRGLTLAAAGDAAAARPLLEEMGKTMPLPEERALVALARESGEALREALQASVGPGRAGGSDVPGGK